MTRGEKEKIYKILNSPILFGSAFCKVVNKQGKTVLFHMNPQQEELVNGLSKYNIVLKSRQLGITTVSCCLSLYYAIVEPNSHCMLISFSLDSANTIFDKLKQMYDSIPNVIKPKELANNRSYLKFENGSKITVCTMGSKELARGSSLKFVHISEIAFCKQDVVSKQLLAIEQALLPSGKIVLESTANGMNDFSEIWEKAEQKESLYKPFFFNWINDKLMFAEEYIQFSKRYKEIYGKNLTVSELDTNEQTYFGMGATLKQLMWRRLKIANSTEKQFRQEYPATSIEAFITTGANIFNVEKVQQLYNERKKIQTNAFIDIVPTILKVYIHNCFKVWENPQKDMKYYIGVDSAQGIGQDYTVVDILDTNGMEVAQFRTNKIQAYEMAIIVNEIGLWYNKALIVVEKASTGGVILDRLKNTFQYRNIYKSKDYDKTGRMRKKIGWITSSKTKPLLINDFVEWFDNDDVFIRSIYTLSEMKTYMFDGSSSNAETGRHDDTIIACALAIQGIKQGFHYLW